MTPASNPIRAFTVAVLEQAVMDYVTLRELGFVAGLEVNGGKLDRILAVNPRYSPNGYFSAREIAELVWFLDSDQFVRLCTLVGEENLDSKCCMILFVLLSHKLSKNIQCRIDF